MKACPVCHARTFDDADVCYGCMHRYEGQQPGSSAAADDAAWEPDDGLRPSISVGTAPPTSSKRDACAPRQEGGPHAEHASFPQRAPVRRRGDDGARIEEELSHSSLPEGREGGKTAATQPLEGSDIVENEARRAQAPLANGASMLVRVELPEQSGHLASSPASTVFEKTMVLPPTQKREALSFPLVISIMPIREGRMREGALPERQGAALSQDGAGSLSLREVVGA